MSGQRAFRPLGARRQAGFTLIETLAAFILLALFLGVLLSSLGTAMRHTVWAEQQSLAAEWAQSKLDLVGVGEPIEEGNSRDRFDDTYHWQMQVSEYDPPRDPPQLTSEQIAAGYQPTEYDPESLGMYLYRIDLTVLWGERDQERSLVFTTVRAYSPDQAVLFNPDASGGADPAGQYGYGAGQRGGNSGQQRPTRPGQATR
ncbi:MAG: prepilin-type N-terminal cleavage/methylation domain-containing protein [Xanthomonadales bacterium]|nr:prepilin-type N-terminal cleavage/methylation domain-containing protein [Xanthomonadales bacterium]